MVRGWDDETMSEEDTTPVEEQQAALEKARQAVPRGASNYGERVLVGWHNILGYAIHRLGEGTCDDCYETATLYWWRGWGELCGWCSYARFTNGGENPREVTDPAERPDEWWPSGRRPSRDERAKSSGRSNDVPIRNPTAEYGTKAAEAETETETEEVADS